MPAGGGDRGRWALVLPAGPAVVHPGSARRAASQALAASRKSNFGGRPQRKWRNHPKAAVFGGKPAGGAPAKLVGLSDMGRLAQVMERIEKFGAGAEQDPRAAGAAPAGGAATAAHWRAPSPEKQRLEVAEKKLAAPQAWADAGGEKELCGAARGVAEAGDQRVAAEAPGKLPGCFAAGQELTEAVLRQASEREKQVASEARAAEAAAAERRAAAAPGQGREPAASEGDGRPREAGDDFIGDEELNAANQRAILKKAGHAPDAEEGAEWPPDDAARAAYKRFFDDPGASPLKKQLKRARGQRGRYGAALHALLEGESATALQQITGVVMEGAAHGDLRMGEVQKLLLPIRSAGTLAAAVQEHHRLETALAAQQRAFKDAGLRGLWSAATAAAETAKGTQGGGAALALLLELSPSDCACVMGGLPADNLAIVRHLAQFLGDLEASGRLWEEPRRGLLLPTCVAGGSLALLGAAGVAPALYLAVGGLGGWYIGKKLQAGQTRGTGQTSRPPDEAHDSSDDAESDEDTLAAQLRDEKAGAARAWQHIAPFLRSLEQGGSGSSGGAPGGPDGMRVIEAGMHEAAGRRDQDRVRALLEGVGSLKAAPTAAELQKLQALMAEVQEFLPEEARRAMEAENARFLPTARGDGAEEASDSEGDSSSEDGDGLSDEGGGGLPR
ncbi:unnamed protein product [Prorocentrum cordatum]|uniref:Uncharacterized protein n=1 Tax=Prorocentrum cordatum TaxID=2364126 RepID=A0ABN9U733_9DINO|nr:unnamed protein product [Polarella glacialis]